MFADMAVSGWICTIPLHCFTSPFLNFQSQRWYNERYLYTYTKQASKPIKQNGF